MAREKFWVYLLLTVLVILGCALVALIPWIVGEVLDACPKSDAGCWRDDVTSFFAKAEPAFIVIALVGRRGRVRLRQDRAQAVTSTRVGLAASW